MVPVGAVVGRSAIFDRVFDSVERSVVHSSTFRENPLAMAVGLASLHAIEAEDLVAQARVRGRRLFDRLGEVATRVPGIREVRGRGLMIGIELDPSTLAFDLPGYGSRTPTLVAQAVVGWMLKEHRVLVQSTAKASAVVKVVRPWSSPTTTSTGSPKRSPRPASCRADGRPRSEDSSRCSCGHRTSSSARRSASPCPSESGPRRR